MKSLIILSLLLSSCVWAAEATFDVKLSPAGSFTGKTSDVKGVVRKAGNKFVASNIIVSLKNIKTGMGLRDKHTKNYLDVNKYPDAVLVKAVGENGKGTGVIRIKGIEKEIKGTYKTVGKDFVAEFPLKLSEFEIKGIRYMTIGVKDDIVVKIKVPVQ